MKSFIQMVFVFLATATATGFSSLSLADHEHHHPPTDHQYNYACATLYANDNGYGMSEVVYSGAQISDLSRTPELQARWNNSVAAVEVYPGCHLTGYQYDNFDINYRTGYSMGGMIKTIYNHHFHSRFESFRYTGFENKMSSLTCYCK